MKKKRKSCKDCRYYVDKISPECRHFDPWGVKCTFFCSVSLFPVGQNFANPGICELFEKKKPDHIVLWEKKINAKK